MRGSCTGRDRRRSHTHPHRKKTWLVRGGAATLLAAFLVGTAALALFAEDRAAYAQSTSPRPTFVGKEVEDLYEKANKAVARCDKAAASREISNAKKLKEGLEVAAKTRAVQGAGADAKTLGEFIPRLEKRLSECVDTHKVTGPGGLVYGFANKAEHDIAATAIADAERFVRDCNRDGYKANIKALLREYQERQGLAGAAALLQLIVDLEAAEAEAFKNCPEPGKAQPPKADAPKTEPAKTGTGTGGSTTPPKPPEPPKAPQDSPDEHGSAPTLKFRADLYGYAAFMPQFGAGTFFPAGQRTHVIESPGTLWGAGFGLGLDVPSTLNVFGVKPWWSFDLSFARAGGSTSGSVAPGTAAVAFDYITPNPASGLTSLFHFANGLNISVKGHRSQLDVAVLLNAILLEQNISLFRRPAKLEVNAGIGLQYRAIWDSYDIDQSIINFPTVTSVIHLDSNTHFFGPKFMARAEYEQGRYSVYIGAYIVPGVAFGSGTADQQARCPVCAASEQNVNLSRNDSFTAFAVNLGTRAWVAYDLTPSTTAWAFIGYDYFSHTARWQLDPGNAHLRGGSTGDLRLGVALKVKF